MMNRQASRIRIELEAEGWELVGIESPTSEHYWWVWQFWSFIKDDDRLFLSFLIDPQSEKTESNVWAVAGTREEPDERLEAESGVLLTLGKGWETRLSEFISQL